MSRYRRARDRDLARQQDAKGVPCPQCGAARGKPCRGTGGGLSATYSHRARRESWEAWEAAVR